MSPDPIPARTPSPPVFDFSPGEPETLAWRSGRVLVMAKNWDFDDRCIKCGTPADERVDRNLYWHPPLLYLTILAGVLVYVVLALVLRKHVALRFAVCPAHRREHWQRVAIAWSSVVGGLALIFMMVRTNGLVAFGGLTLLLFGVLYAAKEVPYLKPKRIEDELAWLVGCSREFLAPLPELK